MFKLHMIQAQFGDSVVLEFGTAGNSRYVLIDGGPHGNFDADLAAALTDIVGKGGTLDLVVLSHIDNDHIVGVVDLFAALEEDEANSDPRRVNIGGLWHNSFTRTLDPHGHIQQGIQSMMNLAGSSGFAMPLAADAFFGVREGNRLRVLARKLDVAVNKGFADDLILLETAKNPLRLGPLTLTIAGPNRANLRKLQKEWLEWLAKAGAQVGQDPSTAAMADKSVPNLSSIVIHVESGGKTILLTGDARGDFILDGLNKAKLTTNGKLHVDVLKVPHHGSDRNATRKFFAAITADTYAISANGRDGNPDYATLTWIVETAQAAGRTIKIVVTNTTDSTTKLMNTHKPNVYNYELLAKPADRHSIAVALD